MFTRRRFISAGIFIFAMSLSEHAAWAEPAPAWAPWIALEQAEGGQLSAPIRTQRLLGLGRAFMLHRRPNPDVERLVAEMEKRIAVLDAASFYDLLGRGHPDSKDARWFELEGRWAGTTYPIKAWRRAPRPDDFGELSAHFGLRPAVTKGGFVLETALSGHLGDLRFEHVAAFVREVLVWLEATRQDPGAELRRAFPRTAPLIQRYATVGAELSPGEAGSRVRLRIALQNEHIREDFPHLGGMLERLRGLADADIAAVRGQAQIAKAKVDSKNLITTVEITISEGQLVPTSNGRRDGAVIDLPSLTQLDYDVQSSLRSNLSGLEISVNDLVVNTRFRRQTNEAAWSAVLNRTPKVKASGSFGIIPLWMVDAFIPSDVESLATDFFRTMAEGNGGAGLATRVEMPVGTRADRFAATAAGELLSNGFLTFCLRTVLQSMGDREALRRDVARMWAAFLDAFEADLKDARAS